MENDYLGPRRIEALQKEDSDWQKKAQEAVLNIQEFTVKYFEITARAQKGTVCQDCCCQCQVNKAAEECRITHTTQTHAHLCNNIDLCAFLNHRANEIYFNETL